MAGTTTYPKTDLEPIFNRITRRGYASRSDQAAAFDTFWNEYSNNGVLIEDAFRAARAGAPDLESEVKKLRSELDRLDKAAAAKPTRKSSSPTKEEERKEIDGLAEKAKRYWEDSYTRFRQGTASVGIIQSIANTLPTDTAVTQALTDATGAISKLEMAADNAETAWKATRDASDIKTATDMKTEAEDCQTDAIKASEIVTDALNTAQKAATAKAEADRTAKESAQSSKKIVDDINKLKKGADEVDETFKKATKQAEELRDAAAATTAKAAESARNEAAKAFTERDEQKTKFEKAHQDLSDSVTEAENAASSGDEAGLEAAQTKANEANDDLGKAEKAAAEKLTALKTASDAAVKAQAEDRGPFINAVKPYLGERFWLTALVAMLVSFVLILALAPLKEVLGVLWFFTAGLLVFLIARGKQPSARTVLIVFVAVVLIAIGFEHIYPLFQGADEEPYRLK